MMRLCELNTRWLQAIGALVLCCHCGPACPQPAPPTQTTVPGSPPAGPPTAVEQVRNIEYIVRPKDLVLVPKTVSERDLFALQTPQLTPFGTILRPNKSVWHPRASFGPFFAGSDLAQIQIRLHDKTLSWYHNAFFATTADVAIYQKYYVATGWPPAEATPVPNPTNPSESNVQEPGTTPTCIGCLNDVVLHLASVHYSNLYGGSLRMRFTASEENEVELRGNDAMWDLEDFDLSIFVTPRAKWLNNKEPMNPATDTHIVHVRVGYSRAHQYTLPNNVRRFEDAPLDRAKLDATLDTLAKSWTRIDTAVRFAHGFFHSQKQDDIAANDWVDAIDISDDHAEVWTHVPAPYMSFEMQFANITAPGTASYVESGEYDYDLSVTPNWNLQTGGDPPTMRMSMPTDTFSLKGEESSGWRYYGIWLASDCENLHSLAADVTIRETNGTDDVTDATSDAMTSAFDTINTYWWVVANCSAVANAATSVQTTVVQDQSETHDVKEGGSKKGTIDIRSRLRVFFR